MIRLPSMRRGNDAGTGVLLVRAIGSALLLAVLALPVALALYWRGLPPAHQFPSYWVQKREDGTKTTPLVVKGEWFVTFQTMRPSNRREYEAAPQTTWPSPGVGQLDGRERIWHPFPGITRMVDWGKSERAAPPHVIYPGLRWYEYNRLDVHLAYVGVPLALLAAGVGLLRPVRVAAAFWLGLLRHGARARPPTRGFDVQPVKDGTGTS